MFRPRVIPCLLLRNKGLVKSTKFKDHKYVGDPINAVRIFNAKEADELIFLDISATHEQRRPPLALIEKIGNEAYMPFTVGGGIRTIEDIRILLSLGAEKVAINTAAVENPAFIREAADVFGSSAIVVSLDVKRKFFGKYGIYTYSGTRNTGLEAVNFATEMAKSGAGEIMLNSIDHDGVMGGYDIDLIRQVANAVTIPVIACGGMGSLEDVAAVVNEGNASAAAAGSYFVYQGRRRAVLINFPTQKQLSNIFEGRPSLVNDQSVGANVGCSEQRSNAVPGILAQPRTR